MNIAKIKNIPVFIIRPCLPIRNGSADRLPFCGRADTEMKIRGRRRRGGVRNRHDFELKNSVFGIKNFVIPKIRCTFDTDFAFLGFDAGLELTVDLPGRINFLVRNICALRNYSYFCQP